MYEQQRKNHFQSAHQDYAKESFKHFYLGHAFGYVENKNAPEGALFMGSLAERELSFGRPDSMRKLLNLTPHTNRNPCSGRG